MPDVCVACWERRPTEMHHPAGRSHHPETIPVCVPCHRILTRWGNAAGLTIEHAERSPLDCAIARVIGLTHLMSLTNTVQARRLRQAMDLTDMDRDNRLGPAWKRLKESK